MQASDLNPHAKPFDFLPTPPDSPEHSKHERTGSTLKCGQEGSETLAPAPTSRRMSKKDAAAAARRRRHSVDALDFTGLRLVDVATFLRHIRLHKYTDLFQGSGINFAQLLAMGDAELDALGVHAQGARTRLLKALGRYNDYLALNWEDRPAADALEAIIPMRGDIRPRGRSRRNSAPSMFSWPPLAVVEDEERQGGLSAISEAGLHDGEGDDGLELCGAVASAAEQLLSILDDDTSDGSEASPRIPLQYTDTYRRARAVSAPEPPPVLFKGFDIWASTAHTQAWGGAFESSVRAL
eukprot:comp20590_c0_seq1/m.26522 comp20590_c0_seq1/g.26522  ORF comp20590_c0_seq1/g.26522 comp20590_c0_seq1/m.26522 type:complete len:296 (-) comp20590_c0_seq1:222-1109(-)